MTSLKIAIIGAGNVATHLGPALQMAGHRVVQVFSRTASSASALADRLSCGFVTDAEAVTADAELYVFCVRDAVLSQLAQTVWRHLRSVGDAGRRPGAGCDGLFIHTAGSLPVDVLPAERRGVLYPLQTFSRARQIDFRQVPLFIESPSDEDFLLAIASQLSLTTCLPSSSATLLTTCTTWVTTSQGRLACRSRYCCPSSTRRRAKYTNCRPETLRRGRP